LGFFKLAAVSRRFFRVGNCLKNKGKKQETGIFSIKTGRAIKPERAITERN
jgi:hypothetical protein